MTTDIIINGGFFVLGWVFGVLTKVYLNYRVFRAIERDRKRRM
jgi:hypothetical protein